VVSGQIVGKELQSDKPVKCQIFSPIDHTHTAATEFLQNPIMGYRSPGHGLRFDHDMIMSPSQALPYW
jgi:hypothetical protein